MLAAVAAAGVFLGSNWGGAPRFAAALTGVVLLAGGLALSIWGIRDLDSSISPFPHPSERGMLVEHGVYDRVRHPIYAGVVVAAVGWALITASFVALMLTVVLALVLDLKARREEAWLLERYPAYADYARRTRRFLPGLY